MRKLLLASSPLLVLLLSSPAHAADWYVSPTGTATSGCTTRATPCSLAAAGNGAQPGDTVILMDGLYKQQLSVSNSGTMAAWITFKADECATPILEGPGVGPDDDAQDTGVFSAEGEYLRFEGLVVRGWNIGFGNSWAGGTESNEVSNGHWEINHCISYSNGRTGFTFFSAPDYRLTNSISAHNGSSKVHSWSSGVSLFEASGTLLVQGVISFENTDEERHTDGSGFIVDEGSNNATFVNNIAFLNSGSCFRLTKSSGTTFVNNTCYHNSQFGGQATGPTNPGELYFTNGGVTQQNVNFKNNVIVGTGQAPAGSQAVQNQPSNGWTKNVVTTGNVTFFTDPEGTNPQFAPAADATMLVGAGATGDGVPSTDVGFDPKCIVKRTPVMSGMVAKLANWKFDIDIDYIKSIGGVEKCFHPAMRSGTPDVGAYKSGAITTAMPGTCTPPMDPSSGRAAGAAGAAGASSTAGAGGVGGAAGGAPAGGVAGVGTAGAAGSGPAGGVAGAVAGGAPAGGAGGVPSAGSGSSGAPAAGSAGSPGNVGGPTTGGQGTVAMGGAAGVSAGAAAGSLASGATTNGSSAPPASDSGCGCRTAPGTNDASSLGALGFLALAMVGVRRRRQARD